MEEEPMELDYNQNLDGLRITIKNDLCSGFAGNTPIFRARGRGGRRGRGNRGRGSRGGGHGDSREDMTELQDSPSQYCYRGRGRGRGRGSMNTRTPKKSANERLLRSPLEPEKKDKAKSNPDEEPLTNDSKIDRTFQREVEAGGPGCICLRSLQKVFCEACGFCTEGRLSKPCPIHPRDSYLLDISSCPRKECGLRHFEGMPRPRLVEFPFPKGFASKIVNRKL